MSELVTLERFRCKGEVDSLFVGRDQMRWWDGSGGDALPLFEEQSTILGVALAGPNVTARARVISQRLIVGRSWGFRMEGAI